jgi:hypothetical protein
MASDDLDKCKAALEDWIDSLSSWMIGFTWPVVIGLVMEFASSYGAGGPSVGRNYLYCR